MPSPEVRKGMPPVKLDRAEFERRFKSAFVDPAFDPLERELQAITAAAWDAYSNSRKAPHTRKAGAGFADPDYDLSVDWLAARDAIAAAQGRQADPGTPSRVRMILGAARNDGSCPGEISKTFRLSRWMAEELDGHGIEVDTLDLSLTISEYGRTIHPCKGCVSTAMPLCHWPCSCYSNHSLRQT